MSRTPFNGHSLSDCVADNCGAIGEICIMFAGVRIVAEFNRGLCALYTADDTINSLLENLIGHK